MQALALELKAPPARALALFLALATVSLLPGVLASDVQRWLAGLCTLIFNGVAIVESLALRRASHLDRRGQRGWAILSLALSSYFLGNLGWIILENLLDRPALGTWADLFFLTFYPLAFAGLMYFIPAGTTASDRYALGLDAAITVVAFGTPFWHFIFAVDPQSGANPLSYAIARVYPIADVLLLFGIAAILLLRRGSQQRAAMPLLAASCTLLLIADLIFAFSKLGPPHPPRSWLAAIFSAALLGIALAARIESRQPPDRLSADDSEPRLDPFTPSPLTLFAATLGCALLLITSLHGSSQQMRGVMHGSALLLGLITTRQAMTWRRKVRELSELARRQSEDRFSSLLQQSFDVVTLVEPDATIRYVSSSVSKVLGHEAGELVGTSLLDLVHPDDRWQVRTFLLQCARSFGTSVPAGWRLRHRDGSWRQVESAGSNRLADPSISGLVLNTRDVTDRARLEAQVADLAFHDPLTHLANRALFRDRVEHSLAWAAKEPRSVAVICLDVDSFRTIVESLGPEAGDRLLTALAKRLTASLRAVDTVARLGSNQFAVLLEDEPESNELREVLHRLNESFQKPFELNGREIAITVSMGIARWTGAESADTLLRNADIALYTAKRRVRGSHALYEPDMHVTAMERLELEIEVQQALSQGSFYLHYQPIVELATERVRGFEALLRWRHPARGMVSPAHVIGIAEETGLILPLGRWILTEACRQATAWQAARPNARTFTMSVNLSGRQLQSADFVAEVAQILAETQWPAERLTLEITETSLLQDTETMIRRLQELKEIGVRLALDDFGTGYSSLAYLQRFPIDYLKIDKSFIEHVASERQEGVLAKAILGLGETLGIMRVAEGVDEPAKVSALRQLGCELAQGYQFSRPVSGEEIQLRWLSSEIAPGSDATSSASPPAA